MWFFSSSFQGIEVLQQLRSLNLSHNALRNVDGLALSSTLVELRLAVNEIQDISSMPSLTNLKILDVSNNKVTYTQGSVVDRWEHSIFLSLVLYVFHLGRFLFAGLSSSSSASVLRIMMLHT